MLADVERHRAALAEICRRHHVAKLEVFGSAAHGRDFDPARSDIDFLVTFAPDAREELSVLDDLKASLEAALGRPVDLVEREAVEGSRNFIRRRAILGEAQAIYG
jgi:predicted nucleotidyltransferase